MTYSPSQLTTLRHLDGILEFDGIRTTGEFIELFNKLHTSVGIPVETIASAVQEEKSLIQSWMQGAELPQNETWQKITEDIRNLIKPIITHK